MVISGALADAAILNADVDGLELHGTGTALGDPIEIGAATTVLQGITFRANDIILPWRQPLTFCL